MVTLAPIAEKGGHRIEREVIEHFRGWCAICHRNRPDADMGFKLRETEIEARLDIANHLLVWHDLEWEGIS